MSVSLKGSNNIIIDCLGLFRSVSFQYLLLLLRKWKVFSALCLREKNGLNALFKGLVAFERLRDTEDVPGVNLSFPLKCVMLLRKKSSTQAQLPLAMLE